MTLREWCQRTYNVLLGMCDARIYEDNKPPKRYKVGFIPDEVALKEVKWVNIKEINPDTMFVYEIEVKVE